jgi:hypothetical protein
MLRDLAGKTERHVLSRRHSRGRAFDAVVA